LQVKPSICRLPARNKQLEREAGLGREPPWLLRLIAYQEFLTLWKDADPDIPILKQAKAEYAKLQ